MWIHTSNPANGSNEFAMQKSLSLSCVRQQQKRTEERIFCCYPHHRYKCTNFTYLFTDSHFFERRSYTLLPRTNFISPLPNQPHYADHSRTFYIRSTFIMDGKKNRPLQSLTAVQEVASIPPYSSLPKVVVSILSNSFDDTVHRVYYAVRLAVQKTLPTKIERWVYGLCPVWCENQQIQCQCF